MTNLWQDLRYSARVLARAPGFSVAVVLTLALAIGATTAVFSVVNTVLLRSLPFAEPERLVLLYEAIPKAISGPIGFSAPDFKALRAAHAQLHGHRRIRHARGRALGRAATRTRDRPACVGRALRRARRLPGDRPDVHQGRRRGQAPGRDTERRSLAPHVWRGPRHPRTRGRPRSPALHHCRHHAALVRVPEPRPAPQQCAGGSLRADQLQRSRADRLRQHVQQQRCRATGTWRDRQRKPTPRYARLPATWCARSTRGRSRKGFALSASAVALRDETVGGVERILYVLLASIGVVLLIACADVANLMLTRAAARGREIAVRSALGAGRGQLARQVLVEAALLAVVGGALGVLVAYWSSAAIVRMAPATIPRLHEMSLDLRVLGFAVAVTVTTAIVCGLLPALELSRRPSGDALKDGGRGGTTGVRQRRVFGALVAAQFALAIVLLVAGGLLLRSFTRLMAVDPGFRAEQVLTLVDQPALERLSHGQRHPVLLSAGSRTRRSAAGRGGIRRIAPICRSRCASAAPSPSKHSRRRPRIFHTSSRTTGCLASYFEAMGIALQRGRYLSHAGHRAVRTGRGDQRDDGQAVLAGPGSHRPAHRVGRRTEPWPLDAHRRHRRRREAGSARHGDGRPDRTNRGCKRSRTAEPRTTCSARCDR